MIKKIVLAYSGGLDTSVAIPWLKDTYGAEVIAFCADLGQREDLKKAEKKALASGATKVYMKDLKEEFVKHYVFPMLRANAVYEDCYLLGTSIARPLIAKKQVDIARKEKADAVAHGATGKGNDQLRFEFAYYALQPNITVIAPWREWEFNSRESLIAYARQKKIPVTTTTKKPYSIDRNLFHISYEGGLLEDPWTEPPADMYEMTRAPEAAAAKPQYVEITFKKGNPVAVNGKKLSPAQVLEKLNTMGAKHGIGRADIVENRSIGIKSRGVYETPGGTILHSARKAMESITLDREVMHLRSTLMPKYATLIYNGLWFSPERIALQKFFDKTAKPANGTVRLKLYRGTCGVAGRKSSRSLYNPDLATFEADTLFDHKDAEGFIKLQVLRLKANAELRKKDD